MALKALLLIHILALATALGAVLLIDLRLVRLLSGGRVTQTDLTVALAAALPIRVGLALLYATGVGFLVIYWITDPHLLTNPKIHAKMVIVGLLMINAVAVERIGLPLIRRNVGRALFHGVHPSRQAIALAAGAISGTAWLSATALGLLRELNFITPMHWILLAYAVATVLAIVSVLVLRCLLYRPGMRSSSSVARVGRAVGAMRHADITTEIGRVVAEMRTKVAASAAQAGWTRRLDDVDRSLQQLCTSERSGWDPERLGKLLELHPQLLGMLQTYQPDPASEQDRVPAAV